jgi:hypothetical protein
MEIFNLVVSIIALAASFILAVKYGDLAATKKQIEYLISERKTERKQKIIGLIMYFRYLIRTYAVFDKLLDGNSFRQLFLIDTSTFENFLFSGHLPNQIELEDRNLPGYFNVLFSLFQKVNIINSCISGILKRYDASKPLDSPLGLPYSKDSSIQDDIKKFREYVNGFNVECRQMIDKLFEELSSIE